MRNHKNFCSKLIPRVPVYSLVVLLEAANIQILEVRPNYKPEQQETLSDKSKDVSMFVSSFYIENNYTHLEKKTFIKFSIVYSTVGGFFSTH